MMDHDYIEEHSLIERYHLGQLEAEEEERFEAHFSGCPQCAEQLELARDLQLGLRALAAEDAARTVSIGLLAWFGRRSRSMQAGLLAGVLLVVFGLPVASYLVARSGQQTAMAEARAAAAEWQQRYLSEQQGTTELQQQLATSERHRAEEQHQAEARLAELESTTRESSGLLHPLVNTPVFLLTTVRADEPAATIDLASIGDYLMLAVDAGDDPRFVSYRITITSSAGGDRLWHRDGLLPNSLEAVMVTFPAQFFTPGDYRLTLAGVLPDGSNVELSSHRYRVMSGQ